MVWCLSSARDRRQVIVLFRPSRNLCFSLSFVYLDPAESALRPQPSRYRIPVGRNRPVVDCGVPAPTGLHSQTPHPWQRERSKSIALSGSCELAVPMAATQSSVTARAILNFEIILSMSSSLSNFLI